MKAGLVGGAKDLRCGESSVRLLGVEAGADHLCTGDSALLLGEHGVERPLEVHRLDAQEQGVDAIEGDCSDDAGQDSQTDEAQEFHRFFGFHPPGVAQGAQRPPGLVFEHVVAVGEEVFACVSFVAYDFGDDFEFHFSQEHVVGFAQGCLVGELVELAGRFGAFAIEPADGEPHVVGSPADLFKFAREFERGEVEHDREPKPGADIRGAGGEVAEPWVVGVVHAGFDLVIEFVGLGEAGFEGEPGADGLDAEVVLFVDHDAHALVGDEHRDRSGLVEPALPGAQPTFGVLAGHELAFDEQVAVFAPGVVQVDPHELRIGAGGHAENSAFAGVEDLGAVNARSLRREGEP